jgi:ankyrin repeat protein
MVKLLLEHNADVNSFGYQKNTPLHEAIINENYDCAKYLIEIKNADQTIRNEFG